METESRVEGAIPASTAEAAPPRRRSGRLLLLPVLGAPVALLYGTPASHYLSLDAIQSHEAALKTIVLAHPWSAIPAFVAVFALAAGAFLPVSMIFTLTAGLVFGAWLGAAVTVISITIGATLSYLAARYVLGDWMLERAERRGGVLQRIVDGFGRNALSYVLTLRLLPVFPFPAVNMAAGCAAAPIGPYVLGTLLGAIPTSVIYAGIGAGLGRVFAHGGRVDASMLKDPHIIAPLVGLALLSLAPVAIKRWRTARKDASAVA